MRDLGSTDGKNTDGKNIDRRREPRLEVDLALIVWGVDTRGERFLQEVRARDISLNGAMLSGLNADLRSGDVVGILYAGRKARYRVVWIRYDAGGDRLQAAVHRITPDECPWRDLLSEEREERPPQSGAETRSRILWTQSKTSRLVGSPTELQYQRRNDMFVETRRGPPDVLARPIDVPAVFLFFHLANAVVKHAAKPEKQAPITIELDLIRC